MAEYPEPHGREVAHPLFEGGARPDIVCWPHESIYTVLSRFAVARGVSGDTIERWFKSTRLRVTCRTGVIGLETLAVLNLGAAIERLGVSWNALEGMFLRTAPTDHGDGLSPYLRFCTICMGARRHFVFFQRERLQRCPFHRTVLLSRCPACGHNADYTWGAELFLQPFCCPACRMPLAGAGVRQSFHDLLTSHREALFTKCAYPQTPMDGSFVSNPGCPGFLLTHPRAGGEDCFSQLQSSLLERRVNEANWSLENGFVQVRTPLGQQGELRWPSEVGGRDLVQCLKSILRHVRQCWRLHSACCESVAFVCPSKVDEDKRRAYQFFCESWGISQDVQEPMRTADRLEVAVCAWLVRHNQSHGAQNWPRPARAWFTTHCFALHVLDSLSRCMESAAWSPDVARALIQKYVSAEDRPIWPLELIYENDRRSYRLLRQQRFLSQLLYDEPQP